MKAGHHQRAEALLLHLKSIAGPRNLFVELQDNGRVGEMKMNGLLVDLAKMCEVECVVTGGPFYLDQADAGACNALRKANGNNLLAGNGFNFRSGQEQVERFRNFPEAVKNSVRIAKRCALLQNS